MTSEQVKQLNVYQRIHAVMREIGTIKKNGYNSFQKYGYASEADFVHALRPLLDKYGLIVTPRMAMPAFSTADDKGTVVATAVVEFTITNIDNPEQKVVSTVLGQGADKGDKAVYKLMTGAKKYWAALNFFAATGDDPEKDEKERVQVKRGTAGSAKPVITISNNDDF